MEGFPSGQLPMLRFSKFKQGPCLRPHYNIIPPPKTCKCHLKAFKITFCMHSTWWIRHPFAASPSNCSDSQQGCHCLHVAGNKLHQYCCSLVAVNAVHVPGNPFVVQEHFSVTSNIFLLLQENSNCVIFIHSQTQENLNTPAAVFTQCVYSILMPS